MISSKKKLRKSDECLNCGREINDYNFCPDCGQINTHKQISFTQIVKDLLGEYFTFDSKFFRSFVPLVNKPGHLTTEYIVGKRATYILPMRLFIFTTALFFFMLALTNSDSDESSFQSQKIKNPTDSLSNIFDKYSDNISEETKALIIDELTTHYDIYSTSRSFSSKQIALIDEIGSYDLKASDESQKYFVLKLLTDYRLRNKKNNYYSGDPEDYVDLDSLEEKVKKDIVININSDEILRKGKAGNKINVQKEENVENLDSLKLYIEKFSPTHTNKDNRFINYLSENYIINKRTKKTGYSGFRLFGGDTSKVQFFRTIEKNAEKLSTAGKLGEKIFMMQFMNHLPKVVFCMVPFLALLLKLFYIRSKIYYINHLIFSLHLHSVMLIILIFPLLFGYLDFGAVVVSLTSVFIAIGFYVYSFKALKRVYRQKGFKTFIKINSTIFIYLVVFVIGLSAAGLYTLYVF